MARPFDIAIYNEKNGEKVYFNYDKSIVEDTTDLDGEVFDIIKQELSELNCTNVQPTDDCVNANKNTFAALTSPAPNWHLNSATSSDRNNTTGLGGTNSSTTVDNPRRFNWIARSCCKTCTKNKNGRTFAEVMSRIGSSCCNDNNQFLYLLFYDCTEQLHRVKVKKPDGESFIKVYTEQKSSGCIFLEITLDEKGSDNQFSLVGQSGAGNSLKHQVICTDICGDGCNGIYSPGEMVDPNFYNKDFFPTNVSTIEQFDPNDLFEINFTPFEKDVSYVDLKFFVSYGLEYKTFKIIHNFKKDSVYKIIGSKELAEPETKWELYENGLSVKTIEISLSGFPEYTFGFYNQNIDIEWQFALYKQADNCGIIYDLGIEV